MENYLRAATEADMNLLYEWANEPEVRENSFSTGKIVYEEHRMWYQRMLDRKDCRQYIYMQGEEAIGQVRVTACGNNAEIAYSICADKRGMGYGGTLLRLLRMQLERDFPEVKTLTGKVKPENIASQRAFMSAGYTEAYRAFKVRIKEK